VPGQTDPVADGVHELTVIRESAPGEYVANVHVYNGSARAAVTVELWDLRGLRKRMVLSRRLTVRYRGEQETAFRWRLGSRGNLVGHSFLQADLLRQVRGMEPK
jgi:hypothetical protein